ncbi:MAG: hypothetical protein IPL79_00445 [Myxococcales bacterium]|nr:hypothetical protein [Myxococcales bacterium]
MRLRFFILCAILAITACGEKPAPAPATQPPSETKGDATPDAGALAPTPVAPPIGLTVAKPGAEPLRLMSYGKLAPVSFELTIDTETRTKSGNLVSPTIVVAGSLTPSIEGTSGQLHFKIASVTARDRERQLVEAAAINFYLKGYKPPSFVLGVTSAGDLSPDTSTWKFPEMLFNQEQALHDIIAKWTLVFPDVAVGHGAAWTHAKNDVVNGVALVRTSEVRLIEPEEAGKKQGQLLAQVDFAESAAPQQAMIDGAPLTIISYGATGTISYTYADVGSPWWAPSKGTSTTTLVYDNRGTEQMIVRTTSWSLAPVAKARKR